MEIAIGSHKFRLEMLILMAVLFWVMAGHLLCGCCRVNLMEGLENKIAAVAAGQKKKTTEEESTTTTTESSTTEGFANSTFTSTGTPFADAKGNGFILDPSKWNAQAYQGKAPGPLPEGELVMFANTEFKPECCPNAYSTSTGCACMSQEQHNYLKTRGGNNVPFSEY